MNIPCIELKPAIYSTAQTVDAIIKKLEAYPEQLTNTKEALSGKSIEFVSFDGPEYGQPVGTLSEWVAAHGINLFLVRTRDGNDILIEAIHNNPTKFIVHKENEKNNGEEKI